jgi:hypothetical protein
MRTFMFTNPSHRTLVFALCLSACASKPPSSTAVAEPAASPPPDTNEAVNAATVAAESWLTLVDHAQYDESWRSSAQVFRGAVSTEAWSQAVGGVRGSLGQLISRQVASADFKSRLPGAPDGKYVVIQFNTVFQNKAAAVETVTPMQESDGAWRVSGYFVK